MSLRSLHIGSAVLDDVGARRGAGLGLLDKTLGACHRERNVRKFQPSSTPEVLIRKRTGLVHRPDPTAGSAPFNAGIPIAYDDTKIGFYQPTVLVQISAISPLIEFQSFNRL